MDHWKFTEKVIFKLQYSLEWRILIPGLSRSLKIRFCQMWSHNRILPNTTKICHHEMKIINSRSLKIQQISEDFGKYGKCLSEYGKYLLYWCGSVGWASCCKLKCYRFNSWSGYMPGLWARSLVGGMKKEATDYCFPHTEMFLFLFSSFPSPFSLKLNK